MSEFNIPVEDGKVLKVPVDENGNAKFYDAQYFFDAPEDDAFESDDLKNCSKRKTFELFEKACEDSGLIAKRITESEEGAEHVVFFVARNKDLSYPLVYLIPAEDLGIQLRSDAEECIKSIVCKLNNLFEEKRKEVESQIAKKDAGKEMLTLVPRRIIHDICQVRMYGNKKYPEGGSDNWKRVSKERYRDAAYRHFMAYLDDPQGVDEESGMPHYWHWATNCAFLCEFEDEEREKRLKEGNNEC